MAERTGLDSAGPVLVLAPTGRDAEGASRLLAAERIEARICPTLHALEGVLDDGAGTVLLADEALLRADLSRLHDRVAAQPPWSDLPFVVLTQGGLAARRRTVEMNLPEMLGNVLFLERPLRAMSLISAVRTTLRARQRQRQVRDYLAGQAGAAERAAALLEARVAERSAALETAEQERRQIASALAQAQKMEAVGQLTGGLAHDFNNMLTGISGGLELMQARLAQGRTDRLDHYIGLARQGLQRAAALTHRLLAFSRRQTLDPKPTGVNGLVAGMADLIRSTAGPGVVIHLGLDERLWITLCDAHQLENALLNLCINARDAMPDGGALRIETANTVLSPEDAGGMREARPGEYVTLAVTDTGTGMPPEVMARAFDPFFTTKPMGQGTGLGLSMIYGFVQQSGGNVQIVSAPGEGTTVRLFLPRYRGSEEGLAARPAVPAAAALPAHGTVLVVDDEPVLRDLMKEALTGLGYRLLIAPDGPAGLRLLEREREVDLLVTDVGMPGGMNGRQFAEAARDRRPGLKVLFITGYAETALAPDGLLGPGMQVLTKPFALDSLAVRIREMIAGGPG